MIEPKAFYRELDTIIAKISKEKRGKKILYAILTELENKFGDTYHFKNSYVYEKRGNEFILIHLFDKSKNQKILEKLSVEDEAIQHVLKHDIFILENPVLGKVSKYFTHDDTVVMAMIIANVLDHQYLFMFELKNDWINEEIAFFLNTVKRAFNYQLFSESIDSELKKAAIIQQSLLPTEAPKVKDYQICGNSQPAGRVGGDFFEYFQFSQDNFCVSIGDASGHGLPAALLIRDVVIGLRMGIAKELRLVHTLKKLNEVIKRSTYTTNFVSLFIGEIEMDGHFFYVNAGHPPPFLVTQNEVSDLDVTGMVLSFLSEMTLHRSYIYVEKNSILVLYSDGIIERENEEEEHFGIVRLKDMVVNNRNKNAQEILDLIFENVYKFGNRTGWEDDATLVVIKRTDE